MRPPPPPFFGNRPALSRCIAPADAAEADRFAEAQQLQPELQRALQRIEPSRGQFGGEIAKRLVDAHVLTFRAVAHLERARLEQLTEMGAGPAKQLLAEAKWETQQASEAAEKHSGRLKRLKERADLELWDALVRLHLVDELIEVLEREKASAARPSPGASVAHG